MHRFLMNSRYVNLLFLMGKGKNIQQLSREPKVHMTVSHLCNVTDQWRKEDIIFKETKGRETDIKLTKKGERLVEIVREYEELASGYKPEVK